jgi:hypothetical protein
MAGHSHHMMVDFTSFRNLMRRMRAATKAAKAPALFRKMS